MKLRVIRYDSGSSFLAELEPFLSEDEAGNSLLLGVARSVVAQVRPRRRHQLVLAAVEVNDQFTLVAAMTSPHKLLLSSHRTVSDQAVEALVRDIRLTHPQLPAVFGPASLSQRFAELWTDHTGAIRQPGLRQKLHVLESLRLPSEWPAGSFRPALEAESNELGEWLQAFQAEALPDESSDLDTAQLIMSRLIAEGSVYVWEAETHHAMSMAAKARPTAHGIAINLVYTPYLFRRQGYATACVARLSDHLVNEGWRYITLFTDRANPTANHIYETLGYTPIADFDEYRFAYRSAREGNSAPADRRAS